MSAGASDYRLDDAFWHPRLGIVLLYERVGGDAQDGNRCMDYLMPHPTCAEADAAEFLAFWQAYGSDDA